MENMFNYLNPIAQLGKPKRSFLFAFFTNIILCVVSEFYVYLVGKNPLAVGNYIIFINAAFIVYFSFRDGMLGGFTTVCLTILYYFYIIYTRHYQGNLLNSGIDTTISLAFVYSFLAFSIGYLKQLIDKLIEKEANARIRLETILDQLPVGVIVSNTMGKIEFVNNYTQKLFGKYVKVGNAIEKNAENTMHHNGIRASRNESPSVQVLATGKSAKPQDFVFTHANGEKLYINSYASPVKNRAGQIIAIASISHDITSLKKEEQKKNDFINMTSHELKTPLTSIKVFTQVLEKKLKNKQDTESFHLASRINTQLNKLTMLVGDLLDVTRLEKGKLIVIKEKFLVKGLAEEVIHDLQPISTQRLILKWTTKLPVYGDKERIRQVLTNLVTNAIKYSPEDKEIIIGSREHDNFLEIYVQDFGIGIASTEKKKIFERFYQVGENSTYPGLGLGLYISAQIIKRHKGKLWVESEYGKGSAFWFSLPIYRMKKARNHLSKPIHPAVRHARIRKSSSKKSKGLMLTVPAKR